MSGATKKKMAVSADQFEDAEEETEDFLGEANETPASTKEDASKKVKEDAPEQMKEDTLEKEKEGAPEPAKEDASEQVKAAEPPPSPAAPPKPEEDEKELTTPPSPSEEKETKDNTAEEAAVVKAAPFRPPSAASTESSKGGSGGTSPLDALAAVAVAKEELKVADPKPQQPREGAHIRTDEISCTDVLCGRGGQSNHHPGNIFFRRLVRAKQEEYLKANKREKTVVAKDIVKLIRMLSPPGRFLKKAYRQDENSYVDVGDNMARNKASQALREGAPELREELRDQHSRINAERGGGPEVKLPYHSSAKAAAAAASAETAERSEMERAAIMRKEREELTALAMARGPMLAPYGAAGVGPEAFAAARLRGQADPPDGSDEEAEGGGPDVSAAAMQVAAEQRARRLMLASAGGAPGLGAHFLGPHLGLGGLGAAASLNPFLVGHSPAAAAQLAALGGPPLFSQQALMMASQPSAAALLQASRARELAHFEAANMAAAAGLNPLLLGAQRTAQAPFQDSMRLHELMAARGGTETSKRDREEIEREIDESYAKAAKAAKLSRQYM